MTPDDPRALPDRLETLIGRLILIEPGDPDDDSDGCQATTEAVETLDHNEAIALCYMLAAHLAAVIRGVDDVQPGYLLRYAQDLIAPDRYSE